MLRSEVGDELELGTIVEADSGVGKQAEKWG